MTVYRSRVAAGATLILVVMLAVAFAMRNGSANAATSQTAIQRGSATRGTGSKAEARHRERPQVHAAWLRKKRKPHDHASRAAGTAWSLSKMPCVYPDNSVAMLSQFSELVGRAFTCVMVYNDSSTTWEQWESPWFIGSTYDDNAWGKWATAPGTRRTLIIDQNLFPSSVAHSDWLRQGAAGSYDQYARTLALNLVNAGLGRSVIRLGHEANGNWFADSLPDTVVGDAEWVQLWRNIVTAMRSVPGADFLFDWTVAAGGYRNIPLTDYYPGNAYVDIIGADVYDSGITVFGTARWQALYSEPMGLGTVEAFAVAHGKPLSIGEWGIGPSQIPGDYHFAGDDPNFVNGIASVVQHDSVAYQSYFLGEEEGPQLENSPASLTAYRRDFGAEGSAVPASLRGAQAIVRSPAPHLTVLAGPANSGSVSAPDPKFIFSASAGSEVECSLDGEPFRPCTSATTDVLLRLSRGYHWWRVEAFDSAHHYTSLMARAFVETG